MKIELLTLSTSDVKEAIYQYKKKSLSTNLTKSFQMWFIIYNMLWLSS